MCVSGVRNISFSETADLVTFTEEILNGKHHFLYSEVRIKFYKLFTHDGLVLTVEAYGGQGFNDEHRLGRIAAIVLKLMKVYHMFTEKCYNSVVSTEFLSEKNTFVTGTLRKDRKGNPIEVTGGKHKKGEMWWFEERKKMLPFVNGNTSVMLLRFGMHRHHKLLPLLIALEKKNRSPTLWETTRIQCLKLNKVNRCCPTTQGYEKLWGGTKSRSAHSWNFHYQCILPLPKMFIAPGALSFSRIWWSLQQKFDWRKKKSRSMTPMANFHYPKTIPDSQKNKKPRRRFRHCWKKVDVALINHAFGLTMFPTVPQRLRNSAIFVNMKYKTIYYN